MKVSLNGYGESVTTFEAEDSVRAGYPVKMTGNGKVGMYGQRSILWYCTQCQKWFCSSTAAGLL